MGDSFKLGITYGSLDRILDDICNKVIYAYSPLILCQDAERDFTSGRFTPETRTIHYGVTHIEMQNVKSMIAHQIQMRPAKDIPDTTPIPDVNFCLLIWAIMHEVGHLRHFDKKYQKTNAIDKLMAIQYMASYQNHLYYELNYSNRTYEVEAEKYGFTTTWKVLNRYFPDKKDLIKDTMIEAANMKASVRGYWLAPFHKDKTFTSIEDVINACYDARIAIASEKYKMYPPKMTGEVYVDGKEKRYSNMAMMKTWTMSYTSDVWKKIYLKAIHSRGMISDLHMASLTNFFYPEYAKNFSALDDFDLSIQSCFGITPDETKYEDAKKAVDSKMVKATSSHGILNP